MVPVESAVIPLTVIEPLETRETEPATAEATLIEVLIAPTEMYESAMSKTEPPRLPIPLPVLFIAPIEMYVPAIKDTAPP